MKRKRSVESFTVEVDRDLYQAAKDRLREIAVTPEYAVAQFLITCVNKKSEMLHRFHNGEKAESVIEAVADETLFSLVRTTARPTPDAAGYGAGGTGAVHYSAPPELEQGAIFSGKAWSCIDYHPEGETFSGHALCGNGPCHDLRFLR